MNPFTIAMICANIALRSAIVCLDVTIRVLSLVNAGRDVYQEIRKR